jgi:hypothetical protein
MQCGGAKKMAKGGSAGIVGMPKYGNNPRTQEGRMLKSGGSVGVKQGCPPGKVRLANGGCGERPRFGG